MEQGASQCKQIEKLLTLGEMLDFDCAKRYLLAAKERDDLEKMRAGTDQDGDAVFSTRGASLLDERNMLLENVQNVGSFLLLRAADVG